jgi:hypothetical protein
MSRSYYYLVAGLPDLLLDESRNVAPLREWLGEIEPQLEGGDRPLLRVVRYPYDNRNIVAALEGGQGEHDERGVFGADELAAEIKHPEGLPAYALTFLEAHREGRQAFAGLTATDQLAWLFYEEMFGHANGFVREWFLFDCNLRNLLAALAVREAAERSSQDARAALAGAIVCRTDVTEQILKSTAPDFGLAGMAPWSARVLALPRGDLVASEKGVDLLRWQTLDELTVFSYFGVETVLAFCLKLAMVERWMGLDAAEGKGLLEKLVDELRSGVGKADR